MYWTADLDEKFKLFQSAPKKEQEKIFTYHLYQPLTRLCAEVLKYMIKRKRFNHIISKEEFKELTTDVITHIYKKIKNYESGNSFSYFQMIAKNQYHDKLIRYVDRQRNLESLDDKDYVDDDYQPLSEIEIRQKVIEFFNEILNIKKNKKGKKNRSDILILNHILDYSKNDKNRMTIECIRHSIEVNIIDKNLLSRNQVTRFFHKVKVKKFNFIYEERKRYEKERREKIKKGNKQNKTISSSI